MGLVRFEEYEKDFIWDYKLHFPVPTIEYIYNRMGWNIKNGREYSEAKGYVLSIVREARNYLYEKTQMTSMDRMRIEYIIAHEIEYIYDILEYVMSFMQVAYTSGDMLKFYEVLNRKEFNIPAINYALGNLKFMKKYSVPVVVEYKGF